MADVDYNLTADPATDGGAEESSAKQAKLGKLMSLYAEASTAWKTERSAYAGYYRWWAGDHWHGAPKADWQSKAAPNYIFSTIESVVPILTDGLPRWDATPKTEDSRRVADLGDGILNNVWDFNRMTQQLSRCVRSVQLYGTNYWWSYWDPDARNGEGEIIVRLIDPHNLLVDPSALDFDEANYVFYAENVSVGYIRRMWPDGGEKVKAVVMDPLLTRKRDPLQGDGGEESPQDYLSSGATYGADSVSRRDELTPGSEVDDALDYFSSAKQATLVHAYLRTKDGIKCCVFAGGVLLDEFDGQLDDRFPFSKTVNYPKDGAWHGASEIEFLVNPQQIINSMLAQIIDNAKLSGNPVLVYDNASGFNPDNYVAAPGVAIGVNGGPAAIQWMQVPALDPKLFGLVDMMRTAIDTVSGVHDVTQGRRPAGITAASAIAELQEAAQVRIREKFRMVAAGLEDIGRIVWDLARKYYDRPRILRCTDQSGDPQFVTLNAVETDPVTGEAMTANTLQDSDFDVRIDLGAGLPANKIQKANLGLQLFQLGANDLQGLYDMLDVPNKEKMLVRLEQQKQAQAQQQQAAQGQPTQGGGGQAPQQAMPAAAEDLMSLIGEGLAPV